MSTWIPGSPTTKGHFWVHQSGYVAYAYVYDGYPNGLQPPKFIPAGGSQEFTAWLESVKGLGVFLRISFTMGGGLAAGDHELRRFPLDHHMPVTLPEAPLTDHAKSVLRILLREGPQRRHTINPGVIDRLTREGLASDVRNDEGQRVIAITAAGAERVRVEKPE